MFDISSFIDMFHEFIFQAKKKGKSLYPCKRFFSFVNLFILIFFFNLFVVSIYVFKFNYFSSNVHGLFRAINHLILAKQTQRLVKTSIHAISHFHQPKVCVVKDDVLTKAIEARLKKKKKTKWWSKLSEESTMLSQNKCQTNYPNVMLTIVLPNIAINVFSFELHKRCIMLVTLILTCMFWLLIWRCYLLPKVRWRTRRLISRNILLINQKSPSIIML